MDVRFLHGLRHSELQDYIGFHVMQDFYPKEPSSTPVFCGVRVSVDGVLASPTEGMLVMAGSYIFFRSADVKVLSLVEDARNTMGALVYVVDTVPEQGMG